jgi:glutamate--cysteine ligase
LSDNLIKRLEKLADAGPELLRTGLKGIEKESLRVGHDGHIAKTPHPRAFGSALTHPNITTDYSEALTEFVTPPFADLDETLQFLCDLHNFAYSNMADNELFWATSMPCAIEGETSIPIARYGSSNVGMMKHVYRRGLAWRYGRIMQCISGVHFNYSLPDVLWPVLQNAAGDRRPLATFKADAYFGLTRNFLRWGWIIPYLFGTSPAICKSFLQGRTEGFEPFDANTVFLPYATSLRMSDIGYKNNSQAGLNINYDHLDDYIATLTHAIETPTPEFQKIGIVVDGEYRQLNANMLQIENEFYSSIRPKNIARSGEKPTLALKRRGVAYIEVRALDVSAFDPLGVNTAQLKFIEAFLLLCLLSESPPITAAERDEIDRNQALVARRGREPGLMLYRRGEHYPLESWGLDICRRMIPICERLDSGLTERPYRATLDKQIAAFEDASRTPSARLLAIMRTRDESFFAFARRMSEQHAGYFRARHLNDRRRQELTEAARASLEQQATIEASDSVSFGEYLAQYFSQT